ncbi:MAG TPA: MFS transporter [Acidobacteriaceae bacterium]
MDLTSPASRSGRNVFAVFLCGAFAFLDLYCTQPLLPMLSHFFHVTEAQVGITISASTVGVAVSAILLALFGERFSRKPVILGAMALLGVFSVLTASAHTLGALAIWRLLQGLATPGIFIITIAYITEEWPAEQVPRVMSAYVAGTVFGGFIGRLLGGIIADHLGWNAVFIALGSFELVGVALVARLLAPAHSRQARRTASVFKPLLDNLRNPRLLATFLIGFCMLFTLISTFNFVTFYLAANPFLLSTSELSWLFAVYLVGLVATLGVGRILTRIGLRNGMLLAVSLGIGGILITLIPSLPVVGLGLAAASSGVFIAQTCANSFIRDAAPMGGRVSAAGMYICSYYIGGTVGGMLPGLVWRAAGWPGCVALIAAVLLVAAVTTWFGWRHRPIPDPIPV